MRNSLMPRAAAACMALFLLAAPLRAAPINTGLEKFAWPLLIVAAPLVIAHEIAVGSDTGARDKADKQARRILEQQPLRRPAEGVHTGSLDLTQALPAMLTDYRLRFVEVDTAGSQWLLEKARDPGRLVDAALAHKHMRLSLGFAGDPACFDWKDKDQDFTALPPVRNRRCLQVRFVDRLDSEAAITLDASGARKRVLRWELRDRHSGARLLSLPFWVGRTSDGALLARPWATRDRFDAFAGLLQVVAQPANRPHPHMLAWLDYPSGRPARAMEQPLPLIAHARLVPPGAPPLSSPRRHTWTEAYEEAYAHGRPVLYRKELLVVPGTNLAMPACIFPNVASCRDSFATAQGLVSVSTSGAEVEVLRRDLEGRLGWRVRVAAATLPEPVAACTRERLRCRFTPTDAGLDGDALVLRGRLTMYEDERPEAAAAARADIELVVPASALPRQ